ncbi:MAG: glycerol-3-phosphate 1-O-acyltransferase PlsY [Verrucomicrobiales bacterium]|nr:glycerol-3-phosphate 1-O-acyltransferase PlsY [Verrucomicrobiales bacterium]
MLIPLAVTACAAYFLGSIPTGYLVGRARGLDLRQLGSGNIGATNALRVLGRGAGSFVLLVDALKGFLACTAVPALVRGLVAAPPPPSGVPTSLLPVVGAVFAVLGHTFTCWLRFKGGKGVATSAGVLAGLVPVAFAVVLAIFLVVLAAFRFVSLASLSAAVALPFVTGFAYPDRLRLGLTIVLAVLVVWKHRSNIRRLREGTESRLGSKPAAPTTSAPPNP